jgi:ribosome-associated toxin RatA of RatAB toxin-antitoxin module
MTAAGLSRAHWSQLRSARDALEHPSLAARMSSVLGTPIEEGMKLLPRTWYSKLSETTETVLYRTLEGAISTLPDVLDKPDVDRRHRNLSVLSGAVGGFFGIPGTLVELPVTTMLMLRSIAAIAAREGEDLSTINARMSCMEVFALGGPSRSDDAAETGYYGLRLMMSYHFSVVNHLIAQHGVAQLPGVVAFVRAIAARFGVVISEKAAMASVPVFGAASGALVNAIFMEHYERIAHGHFLVRRLERQYGADLVKEAYESIPNNGDDEFEPDVTVEVPRGLSVARNGDDIPEPAAKGERRMRTIQRSVTVNAPAQRVFDIVANVSEYPDFVDNCVKANTTSADPENLCAELTLRQGRADEDYNIELQLDRPSSILMTFDVEPPMSLEAEWRFEALDDERCRLDITASYRAGSFAKELLVKPILQRVCTQLSDAVAREAERA